MPIEELTTHSAAYVTVGDLAAYWGISERQVYRHIESGELEAIRMGPRLIRVRTREALRFEQGRATAPADGDGRLLRFPEGMLSAEDETEQSITQMHEMEHDRDFRKP